MTILVVGAGATGGYFGLRLARAGRDVTFLVRPRRAAVLRERGLRLTGLGEQARIEPRLVTAAELDRAYDTVLLTVKAGALQQAMDDLAPAVGPRTRIVPFLNGMAHLDALNRRFGRAAVFGGVVQVVTQVNADGDIERLGPFGSMEIGPQDGRADPRFEEVAAELGDAGFDLVRSADAMAAMWHKWVFIATVGALTCLMRAPVGDIVACPGGTDLGPAILAEAAAVARAAGHPVPAERIEATTDMVTQAGSRFASSMYRDLTEGAGTEAEQILGDLVARARRLGVATPLLDLATLNLRVYEHRRGHA